MKASTPPGAAALIRSATPSPYATGITPWLFSHSWLFSLARPMTVAPVRRASWTASEPTPPAAPEMTTVSPSLSWTAWTVPHAVVPATYRPPATSQETFSGLRVRLPASTRTSSAWAARLSENPITSSPGENPPTPAPTSSMTPARSLPCPDGNVDGNSSATAPVRMTASLMLMPAAFTRTRTCPSPGTGRSTSSTRNTSIPPNSPYLTAFGMISISSRLEFARQHPGGLAGSLLGPDLEAGSHHTRPRPPDLVPGENLDSLISPLLTADMVAFSKAASTPPTSASAHVMGGAVRHAHPRPARWPSPEPHRLL